MQPSQKMSVLGFELEWFDQVSRNLKTLYLKYFVNDNTIELLQEKTIFLKRIYCQEVQLDDLFVGNSIMIFNRLLVIKKYANVATINFMTAREFHVVCQVTEEGYDALGDILNIAKSFKVRMGVVRTSNHGEMYLEFVSVRGEETALNFISSCLKFCSARLTTAEEMKLLVDNIDNVAVRGAVTLCVIKPHVIRASQEGDCVNAIVKAGFHIAGAYSVHLSPNIANELLDVYKNVYHPFSAMLDEFCRSPVLALMVSLPTNQRDNCVNTFRELVGPLNPEVAKLLRPDTLRARFGNSLIENAVHCTDLAEDGEMECKFMFEVVANL